MSPQEAREKLDALEAELKFKQDYVIKHPEDAVAIQVLLNWKKNLYARDKRVLKAKLI